MPHTANEVEKRIGNRTKRNTCPFCDTEKWFVLNQDTKGGPIVGAVMTTVLHAGTVPAYTLFCANCGFTRQHVVSIVAGETRVEGS
jgi:C4-type Zn-finger protein